MYIAPACSSACTTGAHLCICCPIGGHLSSSSARARMHSGSRAPRGCRCQRRRDRLALLAGARWTRLTRRRRRPLRGIPVVTCRLPLAAPLPLPLLGLARAVARAVAAVAPAARVARIARACCDTCPTHNTHTHNHTIAATAAVSAPGGAAGTQRSSGAEGDWRRRVRRIQRICGFGRAFAGLTDLAAAGSSSVAPAGRRKVSLTARVLPRGARGSRSAVRRNTGGWQQ